MATDTKTAPEMDDAPAEVAEDTTVTAFMQLSYDVYAHAASTDPSENEALKTKILAEVERARECKDKLHAYGLKVTELGLTPRPNLLMRRHGTILRSTLRPVRVDSRYNIARQAKARALCGRLC